MSYAIEKGVPPPEQISKAKYPFPEMEVGDSFVAPQSDIDKVRFAAGQMARRKGMKFATRRMDDGTYRIWRLS